MKIFPLIAAAAVAFVAMPAAASAAPAPSAPAPAVVSVASVAVGQSVHVRIGDRRHHGRRVYWKRVCRTAWRNHRRVRTCTRVRAWR